jgi:hypothetical protein
VTARILALLLAAAAVAGCTSSGPAAGPTSHGASGSTSAGRPDTRPIATGPTWAATAPSCPFAGRTFVRDTMGMRLGRITVLRSGGRTVGCRFYALQDSPLHAKEHLPGPNQPAVEIVTARYASPVAAHNAFVLRAGQGRHSARTDLGRTVGLCFQTPFYPKDHGTDWACAASLGHVEVLVRSVEAGGTGAFSTAEVTKAVLRRV